MGPGFESPKVHQNENIEYIFNVFVYRGIAQLVESRSPKPLVVGSSPTAPAKEKSAFGRMRIFSFVSAGHNIVCVAHATSFERQLNIIPPQADTNVRCCTPCKWCASQWCGLAPNDVALRANFSFSHLNAQIGHHFPICSFLFATFPSATSSKEQQRFFA